MLAGLAQSGRAEHAALFVPFTTAAKASLRAVALRALDKLDGDAHVDRFVVALEDSSARVTRIARQALQSRAHLVDRATIDALLAKGRTPAKVALGLLVFHDPWVALATALRLAPDEALREAANVIVHKIASRQLYSSPPDHTALAEAFAVATSFLERPAEVARLLAVTKPRA